MLKCFWIVSSLERNGGWAVKTSDVTYISSVACTLKPILGINSFAHFSHVTNEVKWWEMTDIQFTSDEPISTLLLLIKGISSPLFERAAVAEKLINITCVLKKSSQPAGHMPHPPLYVLWPPYFLFYIKRIVSISMMRNIFHIWENIFY